MSTLPGSPSLCSHARSMLSLSRLALGVHHSVGLICPVGRSGSNQGCPVWGSGLPSPHILSSSALRGDCCEAPQPLRGQEVRAPCHPRAAGQGLHPCGVRGLSEPGGGRGEPEVWLGLMAAGGSWCSSTPGAVGLGCSGGIRETLILLLPLGALGVPPGPLLSHRMGGNGAFSPRFAPRDLEQAADAAIEHKNEAEMNLVLSKCSAATDSAVMEKLNRARAQLLKK